MAKFQIKSPSGTVLYEGTPSYTGTYMKPGTLTFRQICSPTPIDFVVGCYVDYSVPVLPSYVETRTGFRYFLYSVPQVKRQARNGKSGESFVYESVTFYEITKLLDFIPFRDMVIDDNKVHFSTRESWSTYENVAGIARRLQACFNTLYGGYTIVFTVASGQSISPELAALMAEEREFTINGETLLGGLDKIYEVWPEVGWIMRKALVGNISVYEVLIGGAGLSGGSQYLYGKGHGLKTLQRNLANENDLVNRLYAYGNTKNMPPRYYNGKPIYCADSVDIPNLMIPIEEWGEEGDEGLPSAREAFVWDYPSQLRNGIRPKVVYFDGTNDNEDIYPTIKGLTVGDMREYIDDGGEVDYPPTDPEYMADDQPLDEIMMVYPDPDSLSAADFDNGRTGADGKVDLYKKNSDHNNTGSFTVPYTQTSVYADFASDGLGDIPIEDIGGGNERSAYVDLSEVEFNLTSTRQPSDNKALLAVVFFKVSRTGAADQIISKTTFPMEVALESGVYNMSLVKPGVVTADKFDMDELTEYVIVRYYLQTTLVGGVSDTTITYSMEGQSVIAYSRDLRKNFKVLIPPFGFDLKDIVSTEGDIRIAMTSGKCAGREFKVLKTNLYEGGEDFNMWYLTLERQYDESLAQYFPNYDYPVEDEDTFVILGIAMPEFYITAAEKRLLAAAQDYLDYYKKEIWQYVPEIDSKFMVENKRRILPAQYMVLIDYNLVDGDISTLSYFVESGGGYFLTETGQKIIVDQSGFAVSVLVDSVTIDEGAGQIPSYKVTLRDRKRRKK